MTLVLFLIITCFILGAMFLYPKWGFVLMWPVLTMYPHTLVYELKIIPFNAGVDDLFMCVFFLIVLLRRNILGGIPIRMGFPVWSALGFFLALTIANINSQLLIGSVTGVISEEFLKKSLKGVVLVCMVYSVTNTVDDIKDMRTLTLSLAFFLGLGAVLVIIQQFLPDQMRIFRGVKVGQEMLMSGYRNLERRPAGALGNANDAAAMMSLAVLMLIGTLRLRASRFPKALRFITMGTLVVAILLTQSRSGFLTLVIPLFLMSVFSKNKSYTWLFILLGAVLLMAFAGAREAMFDRFAGVGQQTTTDVWGAISVRLETVTQAWSRISVRRFAFGQNMIVDLLRGQEYPHNLYLGIPLMYGVVGVACALVFFFKTVGSYRYMRHHQDPTIPCLAELVRWCLVGFAFYGLANDFLTSPILTYMLFVLAILAHRGAQLAAEDRLGLSGGLPHGGSVRWPRTGGAPGMRSQEFLSVARKQ